MQEKLKGRNSSIELLRIIMMLQIIFLHICEYGDYMENAEGLGGLHRLLAWFMWLISRCPVFMFVIIMGYFMLYSEKEHTIKRILKVYIPMYFYSLIIPAVMLLTKAVPVDKYQMVQAFFPILSRTWYFMTLYILVLAFSPYLNVVLRKISKKEYIILIIMLFFIFSVWQPLAKLDFFSEVFGIKKIVNTEGGKSLYDFIYMYILGGFIRRFVCLKGEGADTAEQAVQKKTEKRVKEAHEKLSLPWPNIVNLIIFFAAGVINLMIVYRVPGYDDIVGYNDNPFVVIQCVCLFIFFANFRFHSRTINCISALNLGVYMIHEHPMGREFIWNKVVKMDTMTFFESAAYPLQIPMICLGIFAACALIEFIRKLIFDKAADAWKRRRQ